MMISLKVKRPSIATGYPAKTIHRTLEYSVQKGGFQRNQENPLEADVLILDEVSMIDTILMYHLLKALPEYITLIMVGVIMIHGTLTHTGIAMILTIMAQVFI